MSNRLWIASGSDPEMELIGRLLREAGERVVYALGPDGRRVRADNAYRVTALSEPIPAGATVYRIECDGPAIPADAAVIDHHRPGDPGYGRPPEEFLPASSIGQVIAELARLGQLPAWPIVLPASQCRNRDADGQMNFGAAGWVVQTGWLREPSIPLTADGAASGGAALVQIPPELVLAAAADHCLAAAYRGECPGVDPDALMRWRAASRAAFQRRAVKDVLADVERAREALMDAPVVRLSPETWEPACGVHGRTGACWQSGGPDPSVRTDACYAMGDPLAVADMRGQCIPELPEAAARDGVCFIASVSERDGRTKIVCQSGSPEQIAAFMHTWAPAQGLRDIYGDPARGFAGGYQ